MAKYIIEAGGNAHTRQYKETRKAQTAKTAARLAKQLARKYRASNGVGIAVVSVVDTRCPDGCEVYYMRFEEGRFRRSRV